MGAHYVAQAGLELLDSSNPPASASRYVSELQAWAASSGSANLFNIS